MIAALCSPGALRAQTYELAQYDDATRWTRAATLLTAVLVADLAKGKARNLSAADVGAESARIFGPPNGWTGADTPFTLFRGMYFNMMSDPDQTCELLEASETVVRARCNRPYVDFFGESGEVLGVTVDDYDQSFEAFASAIAEYHGMDWEKVVEGDDIMYTVTRR